MAAGETGAGVVASHKEPMIVFMPSGKRGRFPRGTAVLDAARSLGVDIDSVCGGRALCGRCQVEVAEGNFAKHGISSGAANVTPQVRPSTASGSAAAWVKSVA